MSKSRSTDLRERLVRAVENGMSRRSAARLFGVVPSTAIKWVAHWKATGSYEALPRGGDKRSMGIERHAEDILAKVKSIPDITLAELATYLKDTYNLEVSQSAVWRLLDRHGMTFKKNRPRQRTTTARRTAIAP